VNLKLICCLQHNRVRFRRRDLKMLISPVIDVMEELLEEYRPCFTKPQFQNFSTYTVGLITCEGKKNIQTINRTFMDAKDQSSLNRFLTESPWDKEKLQNKRLKNQCSRKLVNWLFQKFKRKAKPENIYRILKI